MDTDRTGLYGGHRDGAFLGRLRAWAAAPAGWLRAGVGAGSHTGLRCHWVGQFWEPDTELLARMCLRPRLHPCTTRAEGSGAVN